MPSERQLLILICIKYKWLLTTKSHQPYIYIKYVFDGQLLNLDIVNQNSYFDYIKATQLIYIYIYIKFCQSDSNSNFLYNQNLIIINQTQKNSKFYSSTSFLYNQNLIIVNHNHNQSRFTYLETSLW